MIYLVQKLFVWIFIYLKGYILKFKIFYLLILFKNFRHCQLSVVENFFDSIVTDPPYGIRAGARKSGIT